MNTTPRYPDTRHPTRAEIDWHVANGRRLRAEATTEGLRMVRAWLSDRRGALPRLRRQPARGDAATTLRTPLTAIRSAAEILRDHPEMAPQERARFVRILLEEERRLERLVAALTPGETRGLAR